MHMPDLKRVVAALQQEPKRPHYRRQIRRGTFLTDLRSTKIDRSQRMNYRWR